MGGKKAKAADVQKQMESWMKQNNKKKEKPMSKEEADALRYDSYRIIYDLLTLTLVLCYYDPIYTFLRPVFLGFLKIYYSLNYYRILVLYHI